MYGSKVTHHIDTCFKRLDYAFKYFTLNSRQNWEDPHIPEGFNIGTCTSNKHN